VTGPRSERGDTLIEILVAVVIMGVAFVLVLGGLGYAIIDAGRQQSQASATAALRSAAETIAADPYQACPISTPYALPMDPSGVHVSIQAIDYWQSGQFSTTCPTSDQGLQLVTLTITLTSTDHFPPAVTTLEIVKRQGS
jgi:prepilin-type N-terminal cleavage/methylation domain-containing protein